MVRTQLNLGYPLPLDLSHVGVNGPSPGCNVHRRGAQSDWPRLQCLTRGLAHSGCPERERLGSCGAAERRAGVGRGVAQAPHPLGHPGPPKQEAISGPPQCGKPETTARANTLCEQPGTGKTGGRSRRGPRPETSGSRSPGRRLGGNRAWRTEGSIHIAAPCAPPPGVGQPRVHTHARSAGACAPDYPAN